MKYDENDFSTQNCKTSNKFFKIERKITMIGTMYRNINHSVLITF